MRFFIIMLPIVMSFFGLVAFFYGLYKFFSHGPFLGAMLMAGGVLLIWLVGKMTGSGGSGGH
jgi:hypothetical protein